MQSVFPACSVMWANIQLLGSESVLPVRQLQMGELITNDKNVVNRNTADSMEKERKTEREECLPSHSRLVLTITRVKADLERAALLFTPEADEDA